MPPHPSNQAARARLSPVHSPHTAGPWPGFAGYSLEWTPHSANAASRGHPGILHVPKWHTPDAQSHQRWVSESVRSCACSYPLLCKDKTPLSCPAIFFGCRSAHSGSTRTLIPSVHRQAVKVSCQYLPSPRRLNGSLRQRSTGRAMAGRCHSESDPVLPARVLRHTRISTANPRRNPDRQPPHASFPRFHASAQ